MKKKRILSTTMPTKTITAVAMAVLLLIKVVSGEVSSSMSNVEATSDLTGSVSITDHPDLGLKTSIVDLAGSAMSIASTVAPQIPIDQIKPTSVQDSSAAKLAFTEFKTASQSLQGNDQEIDLTTETSSDQGSEDVSLDGKTDVVQPSEQPSSVVQGLNNSLNTDSKTAAVEEQSSLIESSSNDLSSQLSTAQKQPQQQQLSKDSSLAVDLTKKSQDGCNSELNPNCMPVTSQLSDEDTTTLEPSLQQQQEITTTLEPVTSSLLEGFCSDSNADCTHKPTAAMLTQTDKKTIVQSSSADHFLEFEASQDSNVGPNKNLAENEKGNEKATENTISTEEYPKKSERRADKGGLPDVNEIINGLLNVVGEGLTIATNYVKEEHKRKKDALASQEATTTSTTSKPAMANRVSGTFQSPPGDTRGKPSRINNRGPPRLQEIPFENIPLEVLSSVQPGETPSFQVQQRPFQTRLKVTKTKKKPFFPPYTATGIPLPENLLPESDFPITTSSSSTSSPDRISPTPDHSEPDKNINENPSNKFSFPAKNESEEIKNYFPTSGEHLGHIYFPDFDNNSDSTKSSLILPQSSSTTSTTAETSTTTTTTTTNTPSTTASTSKPEVFIGPVRPQRPVFRPPDEVIFTTKRPLPLPTTTKPHFVTGLVFDDRPPSNLVTAATYRPPSRNPDIFDVVVTANQNFGNSGQNGKPGNSYHDVPDILTEPLPGDQFVTIDGKKTYFDIGPPNTQNDVSVPSEVPVGIGGGEGGGGQYLGSALQVRPDQLANDEQGDYYDPQPVINRPLPPGIQQDKQKQQQQKQQRPKQPTPGQPTAPAPPPRLPVAPPVRIDTCIVGDDTTCTKEKNEVCKTSLGISSCFCRPGYGRKDEAKNCQKIVQLLMSMQVDRINQVHLEWSSNYLNPNSREYRLLADEANKAISSAMSLTSLNALYLSNEINRFFPMNGKVTVNATLILNDNAHTRSLVVKRDIQKKLIEVIQARNNNIGNGRLFVDGPLNPIPGVADLNECSEPEMNDCSESAKCINQFGRFTCKCLPGYGDRFSEDEDKAGRYCESCSADYCNGRGTCKIDETKEKVCECKGNYYGRQCELDGEVVAVAIGASVAAIVIIILTLTCLCMWSRRWKREQQKSEVFRNFPPYIIPANGANYSSPASAVAAANYMANLNKAAAMSAMSAAAQANHLQQQQQQQQQRMGHPGQLMQQGTPTIAADKRSRWMAENYSQNIYAQVHPANPAQFQPVAGGSSLYSEPIYSFPQPSGRTVLTLSPPFSPPPPPPQFSRQNESSMYGTLPRSFTGPEMANQRSRRRRLLDVRHLNQYATFRLNPAEVAMVMSPQRLVQDFGSNQDLMLDEETLRATRYNSTRLSMSVEESSEEYESSSSDEKNRSLSLVQHAPPPPPRRRNTTDSEVSVLTPRSNQSSEGDEKVRSLPSVTSAYKPLPPLPDEQDSMGDRSSDDSNMTPRVLRTIGGQSPSYSSSSKKLSVTFVENDVISNDSGTSRSNLLKSLFLKKSTSGKNGAAAAKSDIKPVPILVPRPIAGVEKRHLPLAKRLSDNLKETFSRTKNC